MFLFFDTEFTDFKTLGLISIGIVSEDLNHIFYREVSDYDKNMTSDFVQEVVEPLLVGNDYEVKYEDLALELQNWINTLPATEIYFVADYEGDLIILERLFSKFNNCNKKVRTKIIEKAFINTYYERGFSSTKDIGEIFLILSNGIESCLDLNKDLQHNALYDAMCIVGGWNDGMKHLNNLY